MINDRDIKEQLEIIIRFSSHPLDTYESFISHLAQAINFEYDRRYNKKYLFDGKIFERKYVERRRHIDLIFKHFVANNNDYLQERYTLERI